MHQASGRLAPWLSARRRSTQPSPALPEGRADGAVRIFRGSGIVSPDFMPIGSTPFHTWMGRGALEVGSHTTTWIQAASPSWSGAQTIASHIEAYVPKNRMGG